MICAEWSLFSCSRFFAKWLFNWEELDLLLEARFNSDWCIAFLLDFCLSNRIFNSVGFEWLGLEDKNNSALWSEFFLQILFLIKGRWFITFLSRGNPVPCCPNMHFPKEIERNQIVAVDTVYCDHEKYSILWIFREISSAYINLLSWLTSWPVLLFSTTPLGLLLQLQILPLQAIIDFCPGMSYVTIYSIKLKIFVGTYI